MRKNTLTTCEQRLEKATKVLIADLNTYCSNTSTRPPTPDTRLAFRYVSNFWERLKDKHADTPASEKIKTLHSYESMVQLKELRRVYHLLEYYLKKTSGAKINDNDYPEKTVPLEYCGNTLEIDEELFENSGIKVNAREFS